MTTTTDTRTALIVAGRARLALLPVPGNAELLILVLALLLAAIVVGIADTVDVSSWLDFFKWGIAAYLLSRGITKASRVYSTDRLARAGLEPELRPRWGTRVG